MQNKSEKKKLTVEEGIHHPLLMEVSELGSDMVEPEVIEELARYYHQICVALYGREIQQLEEEGLLENYVVFEERIDLLFLKIAENEKSLIEEKPSITLEDRAIRDKYPHEIWRVLGDIHVYFAGVFEDYTDDNLDKPYPFAALFFMRLAYAHIMLFNDNYSGVKDFETRKEIASYLDGKLLHALEVDMYKTLRGGYL